MRKIVTITLLFFVTGLWAQPFEMDTIQWSGPVTERINFVFLGDGYQENEFSKFVADVTRVKDHFFTQSPFQEYRQYFNLVAIKVPSNASGAARDPSELIDNYFGSTYNSSGIDRLLTATNASKAQDILFDQFPQFDQAVLIVNDSKYGGSGGWLATTSTHLNAPEIAVHELGHSFAGLSDEYWAGAQFASETPNMTKQSDPHQIIWAEWLATQEVGIYPHSDDPTWFKPHLNCKMQVLNPPFCPVCREAITQEIQTHVKPLISYWPEVPAIELEVDTLKVYTNTLSPQPNTLSHSWSLNGLPMDGTSDTLWISASTFANGENILQVEIRDTTSFVRDDIYTAQYVCTVIWKIFKDATTSVAVKTSVRARIYPNPFSESINIELDTWKGESVRLVDNLGKVVWLQELNGESKYQLNLSMVPVGIYLLQVFSNDRIYTETIIKR